MLNIQQGGSDIRYSQYSTTSSLHQLVHINSTGHLINIIIINNIINIINIFIIIVASHQPHQYSAIS